MSSIESEFSNVCKICAIEVGVEAALLLKGFPLIRSFISKSHQNRWAVCACWLPLAIPIPAITKPDVSGFNFPETLLNQFLPYLLQCQQCPGWWLV